MLTLLQQAAGGLLILLVLLDVFMTVLYARIGSGILSYRLARITADVFRGIARRWCGREGTILSFCGPVILVLLILVWAGVLTCGTALVIHPALGTSVRSTDGPTPTGFITAMYVGAGSVAIVGASDFAPHTTAFRLFYLINSLIGVSLISLTLTYLMQIYTALQQRNAFGLKVFLLTGRTKDAAELLARVGAAGHFDSGYTDLSELAANLVTVKESHHFYPVLFYFRFEEPYYSVSLFTLVVLDTVTLLKSALDDQHFGWLKQSAAVNQLEEAAVLLDTTLEDTFLPGGVPAPELPDVETLELWHLRYGAAVRRLRQADIKTIADEEAGFDRYVALRTCWESRIRKLAPRMLYDMHDVDPATYPSR